MLVLTRKPGERILIEDKLTGEVIRLVQIRVGPNSSRLGIEASDRFNIVREELRDGRVAEATAAAVLGAAGGAGNSPGSF
jgi:carbon storage regulator CsrA